jgi:hypothetical protein
VSSIDLIRLIFFARDSQLRLPGDRIAYITIMFVIDQLFALILGSQNGAGSLAMRLERRLVTPM